MEAYGKISSGTPEENYMAGHSERRPCPNGSSRLEELAEKN